MEDNTKQPLTADASLYNGQPSDTGSSCSSARLTSCTPSISDDVKDGVSVENMPTQSTQCFVLRVSYGRILKAQTYIEGKGIDCYVPLRYKQIIKQEKEHIVTKPLLPSFIFVHASCSQVEALCRNINASDSRSLLSFYYDHTSFREDAPDKNPPLIISDSAMDNFIRLTSIKNPHVIPVTSENIKYKLGNEVVITEGEFKGIHGRGGKDCRTTEGSRGVIWRVFGGYGVYTEGGDEEMYGYAINNNLLDMRKLKISK